MAKIILISKLSATYFAFLDFWLVKKLGILANIRSFTFYEKWTGFVFTIFLAAVAGHEKECLQKMTFIH